jgi:hypothetical protein
MQVLVHATYPPTVTGQMIQLSMAPDLPKRPPEAKEMASIVYGDPGGYHTLRNRVARLPL